MVILAILKKFGGKWMVFMNFRGDEMLDLISVLTKLSIFVHYISENRVVQNSNFSKSSGVNAPLDQA